MSLLWKKYFIRQLSSAQMRDEGMQKDIHFFTLKLVGNFRKVGPKKKFTNRVPWIVFFFFLRKRHKINQNR